eukprot:12928100-Prorocentrum_lima.AAC.1
MPERLPMVICGKCKRLNPADVLTCLFCRNSKFPHDCEYDPTSRKVRTPQKRAAIIGRKGESADARHDRG